jgi:hypothetical protein
VTNLSPEDAAMWEAAGLAQLPRMPFSQATVIQRLPDARESPETTSMAGDVRPVLPCACGCGEPVTRAAIGRPALYASAACRMRALRARRAQCVRGSALTT